MLPLECNIILSFIMYQPKSPQETIRNLYEDDKKNPCSVPILLSYPHTHNNFGQNAGFIFISRSRVHMYVIRNYISHIARHHQQQQQQRKSQRKNVDLGQYWI